MDWIDRHGNLRFSFFLSRALFGRIGGGLHRVARFFLICGNVGSTVEKKDSLKYSISVTPTLHNLPYFISFYFMLQLGLLTPPRKFIQQVSYIKNDA